MVMTLAEKCVILDCTHKSFMRHPTMGECFPQKIYSNDCYLQLPLLVVLWKTEKNEAVFSRDEVYRTMRTTMRCVLTLENIGIPLNIHTILIRTTEKYGTGDKVTFTKERVIPDSLRPSVSKH